MSRERTLAFAVVAGVVIVILAGSLRPQMDFRHQDRDQLNAEPSWTHWLGTDAIGRGRLGRVLHGTCLSLSLALAAAGLTMLLALGVGAAAGHFGGATERGAKVIIDLMLSVPW